ncbi:MAG: cobalt-precorrin 5A hydrolase [Desulfobulbaceae bacterium]|nr:cobalt-precorrin 5A hydrolase [Desulfobulbaceae bacterium]
MAGRIAILALTDGGLQLAKLLAGQLTGSTVFPCRGRLQKILQQCWQEYEGLVCIMATGIVVRTLAPLLKDKRQDPAVVVCDEKGKFAVSLLSGHLGGANVLARQVAEILGGQAVITTASDVLGHTALDLWARELDLQVADKGALTRVMGTLVNQGSVSLYSDYPLPELPDDIEEQKNPQTADLVITCRTDLQTTGILLHPRALVAGIGCNRNTPAEEIDQALQEACREHNLALESVRSLASIDLKNDEPGLLEFAKRHGYMIDFYNREQLNGVENVSTSAAVLKAIGAKGVAEPAAVLASGGGHLLVNKMKWTNVTVAIAELSFPFEHTATTDGRG